MQFSNPYAFRHTHGMNAITSYISRSKYQTSSGCISPKICLPIGDRFERVYAKALGLQQGAKSRSEIMVRVDGNNPHRSRAPGVDSPLLDKEQSRVLISLLYGVAYSIDHVFLD